MYYVENIIIILICYLLGSIPSGLIIGKLAKGIDIREHGSGNLGGTNAIRVLGKKLGTIVTVMDILKGGSAVLLGMLWIKMNLTEIDPIIFGMIAVIGHVFPIFAKFRGGKAVATSAGVLLFFNPVIFVIGLITFTVTLKTTRYVSISSSIAALMCLVVMLGLNLIEAFENKWYGYETFNYQAVIVIAILVTVIIYRHIPNYKRLIEGTESKIGQKSN